MGAALLCGIRDTGCTPGTASRHPGRAFPRSHSGTRGGGGRSRRGAGRRIGRRSCCSSLRRLELFAPLYRRGVGIDASTDMLAVARANLDRTGAGNAQVRLGDIYHLPFPRDSFDLITVHQEAGPHLDRTIERIKHLGKKAGVVICPATPVDALEHVMREGNSDALEDLKKARWYVDREISRREKEIAKALIDDGANVHEVDEVRKKNHFILLLSFLNNYCLY